MRKFKKIDLYTNVALILLSFIFALVKQDETTITGYFIVGGWQLISMFVHFLNGWFIEEKSRTYYHRIVMVVIAVTLLGFFSGPFLLVVLFVLLFVSPLMAVYYTSMCYNEVYVKMRRPLSLLK